jgi:prepilin signal peptidase PulO-like enzyme (type II secretory pathway)
MALFPFALFLAAAAAVLLRTRVLPGWLGWVGAAVAVLLGVLGVGLPAGLDIAPLDQVISLLALALVAGLAFCLGWPLPAADGRGGEALDKPTPQLARRHRDARPARRALGWSTSPVAIITPAASCAGLVVPYHPGW